MPQSKKSAITAAMQYIKAEITNDIKSALFAISLTPIVELENGPDGIMVALSVLNRENRAVLQYESTETLTG